MHCNEEMLPLTQNAAPDQKMEYLVKKRRVAGRGTGPAPSAASLRGLAACFTEARVGGASLLVGDQSNP